MAELETYIDPQFSYSPDGILRIVPIFEDDLSVASQQLAQIERLEDHWRAEIVENEDDIVSLSFDVQSTLGPFDFDGSNQRRIGSFLDALRLLLPYEHEGFTDRVFCFDLLGDIGLSGVVYPQFQRWLDHGGVDERTARRALTAMAEPYGEDAVDAAQRELTHEDNHWQGSWFSLGVVSESMRRFGLDDVYRLKEKIITTRQGEVDWTWIQLQTLGEQASLFVDADDRAHVELDNNGSALYKMTSNNVFDPRQSLSLALGMGALAYEAAQYPGREDVLADARWGEKEVHFGRSAQSPLAE